MIKEIWKLIKKYWLICLCVFSFFIASVFQLAVVKVERDTEKKKVHTVKIEKDVWKTLYKNKIAEEEMRIQEEDFVLAFHPDISFKDMRAIVKGVNKHYKRTGLSRMNFYSICAQESRFRKNAVGKENKNDIGLCQINKHTYKYFKKIEIVSEEWNPDKMKSIEFNIEVASLILERYRKRIEKRYPKKSKEFIDMLLINSYNRGVGGAILEFKKDGSLGYYEDVKRWKKFWKEG